MKMNIKYKLLILPVLALVFLAGCESDLPNDYVARNYVEGFLIIDEPIQGIKVLQTQPLSEFYDQESAWIKDADVRIIKDGEEMALVYRDEEPRGYYYPDTTVKVQPATLYKLEVTVGETLITGETNTPKSTFEWVRAPQETMQFPADTIKLPGNPDYKLEWTGETGVPFYLLSVDCLDTAEYGKYLEPPSPAEKNRRVYNLFIQDQEENYYEHSTWNLIANTKTEVVWLAFKWFGLHEVNIYAPDYNYLQWFLQISDFNASSEYNEQLSSIKNGLGVFGSAAKISSRFMLLKNQP